MEEFLAAGMHWRIFNFIVFLGGLFFILRKPVREFWVSRAHQIRFEIDESAKLKGNLKGRYDTLKRRLSCIEGEAGELVRSMEQEGELEKKKMIEEAEQLSRRIRHESERIADQEVQKARETLKGQTVQMAIELADRVIRENIQEADQKRIMEHYLTDLERGAA